jgi:hypothetical protein
MYSPQPLYDTPVRHVDNPDRLEKIVIGACMWRKQMQFRVTILSAVLAATFVSSACGEATSVTRPTPPTENTGSPTAQPPAGNIPERSPAPEPAPALPDRGPSFPAPPSGPPESDACRHSKAQWALGERASDDLLERARVAAGAKTARILRLHQPVTLEYLGSRLNVIMDEQGIVRSVVCG